MSAPIDVFGTIDLAIRLMHGELGSDARLSEARDALVSLVNAATVAADRLDESGRSSKALRAALAAFEPQP